MGKIKNIHTLSFVHSLKTIIRLFVVTRWRTRDRISLHVLDVELDVTAGTVEHIHRGKVRLQAVVTEDVCAAGVRWQNRILLAVGAFGRDVHHRKRSPHWQICSSPKSHYRMLQVMEIDHGYADGEELHQTVPQEFPRHIRVTDCSGPMRRYRVT